jgi:hypothetical protein
MAGRTGVQVQGARELRASLLNAGVMVGDLKDANRRVGQVVADRAEQLAPKRSGRLAGSGRPGAAKTQAVVRFGGSGVPYAAALQWGVGPRAGQTGPHNIRPTLFATNAADQTRETWLDVYMSAVNEALDQVKGT